jgi:F-box/leucine-rich repeat protein 14
VCSSWSDIVDALLPRLRPLRSVSVTMQGKLGWFESVTVVDLLSCENGGAGVLPELRSMPSLRSLVLPASCAERVVDAEALCGLTTVTTLSFCTEEDEDDEMVEAGEWVLDLSRLPTLTTLDLKYCDGVTDKEVLELSNLPRLTDLNLSWCNNVTSEGLRALSGLIALNTLNLDYINVTNKMLHAVSNLKALTILGLAGCNGVTAEGLREVSSLTALTTLNLSYCHKLTNEGLQTLSSLTALSTIYLFNCRNVSAAGKQALRTAIPNLTIWG